MDEHDRTGLDVVAGAVGDLAAPVQTSLLKALSALLGGLTAIPAAKLKQYAQGIEDTTVVRSAVAATLGKAVAENAGQDPLLMQAAGEIYLPTVLRKAKNRLAIAQRTAEHIGADQAGPAAAAPPENDWMNHYIRFAEDASSEKLQDLFGRILAGQIVRPGSFGISTLRAVGELDQTIAADFSSMWALSAGVAVDYSAEHQMGDGYNRWRRLAEAGLISPIEVAQFLPPFSPVRNGNGLWTPASAGGAYLVVQFPEGCAARWVHLPFTRVGREIGSILARPDYEANLRAVGEGLARQGVSRVELFSPGRPTEVIYARGS
jgi:hypothetical protein